MPEAKVPAWATLWLSIQEDFGCRSTVKTAMGMIEWQRMYEEGRVNSRDEANE